MRAFVLLSDGFGGHGGIAKFNRDFLAALCSYPQMAEVVALPRLAPEPVGGLPAKLMYVLDGAGGKLSYLRAVIQHARRFRGHPSPPRPGRGLGEVFDVVLCAHINLLPLAFLASWITGAPVVLNLHGIDAWSPHRNPFVRALLSRVSAFITVSEFTKNRFIAWSCLRERRFFILPNCVDLSAFGAGPKKPELLARYGLANRTIIMTLARLSAAERYKGIDEIMENLPHLASSIPNLTYMICGDGDDRERLMNKAASLRLHVRTGAAAFQPPSLGGWKTAPPGGSGEVIDSEAQHDLTGTSNCKPEIGNRKSPEVIFTGRIPESEKADHFRLADAYVMPGTGEGFGIVYLEALACGVPVVASKLDASREAVLNGDLGVVVDPRDPAELRAGILQALRTCKGVPEKLAQFSAESFESRLHDVLAELSNSSSKGRAGFRPATSSPPAIVERGNSSPLSPLAAHGHAISVPVSNHE